MKQTNLKLNLNVKKTCKHVFLEQANQGVLWNALVELIAQYYTDGKTGQPRFTRQTMLRVHFVQQWFTLSDPGIQDAIINMPLHRKFAQPEEFGRLLYESTIQRFGKTPIHHHRLEKHKLAVEIPAGLHIVRGTSGKVHDVLEGNGLLQDEKTYTLEDAGYQRNEKRPDSNAEVTWHIAMRLGKRKVFNTEDAVGAMIDKAEKIKADIRAKVEHPFLVIERQFDFVKARYQGLKKGTAQIVTLFALSNLRMVRGKLFALFGCELFRPSLNFTNS